MILQALNNYYDRLREGQDPVVPDFGFGNQGVHFCLILDRQGKIVGEPLDLRDEKGKPKRIEVPGPVGRSVGISSNFAWDNTGYVLGADSKGKPKRTKETHEAFCTLCRNILTGSNDEGAMALLAFLEDWKPDQAESLDDWENIVDKYIVFRLDGENRFLHYRPAFRKAWLDHLAANPPENRAMCLITGEKDAAIPLTHSKIKGVPGAQTSGASLISFNFDSAESFNRKQNLNAPVSDQAAFGYATALNHLLSPGSERKIQIGDTTMVFWTDAPGDAEPMFNLAMGGKQPEDSTLVQRLESYLPDIARGRYPDELGESDTPFYVLGLSPNAARISVRFWHVGTVGSMASNLGTHFRDMSLRRSFESDPEYPSPWQILRDLAPQRDSKNMSPLLMGQFLRSIVENQPYPRTLLTAAIGRIRADRQMNHVRAAIIKAYLARTPDTKDKQEIQMSLDTNITDIGYRLGRLFAYVERIQEDAVPGANATVRDRFFASASATPGKTFPTILRNAQHGLAKIRKGKKGWAVTLDKGIQEVLDDIDPKSGFPATLSLEKQGKFLLGYYQQRQEFYTNKENKTEN